MIDFSRYLAAKVTVDDRALNRLVWEQLKAALSARELDRPLRILELGCGIGTMVARLLDWGLADRVIYLGIDSQAENIRAAESRLPAWGEQNGYQIGVDAEGLVFGKRDLLWQIHFEQADVTTFQARQGYYDLLIAQAFLDLIDIPKALPGFERLLSPQGLFYSTINFDGVTIFEPVPDEISEARIIDLYHQSMDERRVEGQPSGDSRAGRHLFNHLSAAGADILAAGSSDWVVFPGPDGYPADEAYFLNCILDFFESTLEGHPNLGPQELAAWLTERREQIERGELTLIAHQLDFLGQFSR